MARYSSVEVKVGFFAGVCAALFVAMLITFSKVAPIWRGRQEVLVAFSDVSSLRPDAPVRYNGMEVGRVKWMRMLHLDTQNLERLPKLTRSDLENLPVRSESALKELRETKEEDFDGKCRREIKNQTMIEICLEVLQEGDVKRYRLDDKIRIVSTVFGDAAVEIISGNGEVNTPKSGNVVIGISGDFFSNLAKSMGDVKKVLESVTDVVGTEERRSFERSTARFTRISDRADKIGDFADKRSDITGKRMDTLSEDINKIMTNAGDSLEKLRPQAKQTLEEMRNGFTSAQDKISSADAEFSALTDDFTADAKALSSDVSFTIDHTKPNFQAMKNNARVAFDQFSGLSARLDAMQNTAGNIVSQSEPDLSRMRGALSNSLTNLKQTGQAAMENKDLMLSNKDSGEYEYNTALDISRRLAASARRIREAGAEVDESTRAVLNLKLNTEKGASTTTDSAMPIVSKAGEVIDQLFMIRMPLEDVYREAESKMLPEFERKRSSWREESAASIPAGSVRAKEK